MLNVLCILEALRHKYHHARTSTWVNQKRYRTTPYFFFFAYGLKCETCYVNLFREKLSKKVHATVPKGIVGGFEFLVLQRNLKELHKRPWTNVSEC